jgi:hypothetical protein
MGKEALQFSKAESKLNCNTSYPALVGEFLNPSNLRFFTKEITSLIIMYAKCLALDYY